MEKETNVHIPEGQLKSYLDHELSPTEWEKVDAHLTGCIDCRVELDALARQADQINVSLVALTPHTLTVPSSVTAARQRLQERLIEKEDQTMLQKIFSRRYRPAWVAICVILVLAVAMAFPPVQAIANSFLGLFRVQQFTVVQVNPGNLPEQLGSASQLEYMFTQDVDIQEGGEPQDVASAAEASQFAGIPVRLPVGMNGEQKLSVLPGMQATFNVDMEHVQALLNEIGMADIQLPENLDGATVTVEVLDGVSAQYGECEFDPEEAHASGYDPDSQEIPRLSKCTTLIQTPSPIVNAPPGLDIAKIGEAFLQVMGMSTEDAAHFAQNIDWTTTFVIPIPRYGTSYQDVLIDDVTGTLILQDLEDHPNQYMLLWVKDDIVYALTGPGDRSTALRIANSLK
jgi:anti-sigma factor RsiW